MKSLSRIFYAGTIYIYIYIYIYICIYVKPTYIKSLQKSTYTDASILALNILFFNKKSLTLEI